MALTFNGSTSSLARLGAGIVTGYPFTLFLWTRVTAQQNCFAAELALDPAPGGVHQGHGITQSWGSMQAYSTASGNGAAVGAYAARGVTTGDWVPCMVVFSSTTLRKVYYGNGAVRTNTVYVPQVPANLTSISVGKQAIQNAGFWKGDLACFGIWNAELTAAEFDQLAAGAVPSTVQSAALVDYWSLLTQAATQTGLNGRVLSASNTSQAPSHPISEGTSSDTTPPTLTGNITVSNLTSTSYTISWAAGTDDVAVTSYDRSLDGGATWSNVGNVLSVAISGRTPGSTDQVQVRARDGAGNVSTPALATAVTLQNAPDTTAPTLTGSITVSNLAPTSYTLSWPAGADNVGIVGYEVSADGGTNWSNVGIVLSANVTGRTPGTTDAVRVRARDAAGNVSNPALSASVGLPLPPDTTVPILTGSITVSGLTSTAYSLSWPTATDNVGVTGYERSLDGGTTWVNVGNTLTSNVSGRTPGATDQVRVRARDAAGNVSSPALSTSVTLPSGTGATLVTPPMKNNTGTLLANLTGLTINVYNVSTGALVLRKTGLASDAAGVVSLTDAALSSGTSYAYEVVTPSNGRRLPTGLAS